MKYRRDELLGFMKVLIKNPIPSGYEERVADLILNKMEELGFDKVYRDKMGNVIGRISDGSNNPLLLFSGYMDVAAVGERENWCLDPFWGETHKERIFGRGSVDMKGDIASMIFGCSTIETEGISILFL